MSSQRLLIHIVREGATDLQLNDEIDEDWLAYTVLIFRLQYIPLVVLNRPRKRRVNKLPPVCFSSLWLILPRSMLWLHLV